MSQEDRQADMRDRFVQDQHCGVAGTCSRVLAQCLSQDGGGKDDGYQGHGVSE